MTFNGSSFAKSKISIRFVVSKLVWKWSQILIPNPDWLETTLIDNSASKSVIFKVSLNIDNIYNFKVFFTTSKNVESLPRNEAPFGSNLLAKFWLHGEMCQFFRRQNLANLVSTCLESHDHSKIVEISQRSHQTWPNNGREALSLFPPHVVVAPHRLWSGSKTAGVLWCCWASACMIPTLVGASTVMGRLEEKERKKKWKKEKGGDAGVQGKEREE